MTKVAHKNLTWLIVSAALIGVVSVVLCSYGYAAVSTDLLISGEATIKGGGGNFVSTYMQDVTPTECENVGFDQSKQLIDKRDGKKYWVTKLRNGECWMTQDLRYQIVTDASGKIELTSELTDINGANVPDLDTEENFAYESRMGANGQKIWLWNENSWLPPTETFTTRRDSKQVANTTYSWYMGDWVVTNPKVSRSGRTWVTDEDEDGNPIEIYKPGGWENSGVSLDNDTMTYNTHYLNGIYYQFNTATAGGRVGNGPAVSSICPKGWSLPQTLDRGSSVDAAVAEYGSEFRTTGFPMYFSGNSYYLNTSIDASIISQGSYYWEDWFTNTSSKNAYLISATMWHTNVSSTRYGMYWGLPVRCVLRLPEATE